MNRYLTAVLAGVVLCAGFVPGAWGANYRALYDCLGNYPGGHAAAEADPAAAAQWANTQQAQIAEEIPTTEVWKAVMAHRQADWRPISGITSGGKSIDDGDREDIRYSVLGGSRQMLAVGQGAWGRSLLLDVFGANSDVISQLQTQFTEYVAQCAAFGGVAEPGDITEAIRLHGG